jgi:hypothetical protein
MKDLIARLRAAAPCGLTAAHVSDLDALREAADVLEGLCPPPPPPPVYLVCRKCGTREVVLSYTKIIGCNRCGAPRFAEYDDGVPAFIVIANEEADR